MPNQVEFWLLLHFEDVHHLMHRTEVMRRLRQHLPGYDKGYGQAFSETKSQLQTAMGRARIITERVDTSDDTEPYTGIVDLVELLTTLKT